MAKKSRKKPKKMGKELKKYVAPTYSDLLKRYSKKRDEIKNAVIGILTIALIVCLFYMFSGPADVQEAPDSGVPDGQDAQEPPATGEVGEIDIKVLELEIHDLVNERRAELGLSELGWNTILNGLARNHSIDMAENSYLSHEDSEGKIFSDRYREAGFNCMVFSGSLIFRGEENIQLISAQGFTQDEIAAMAVDAWIESFEQREKIYKPYWETEGIGAALSGDSVYITQNFC